jgi:AraC-like DNA-binding protein
MARLNETRIGALLTEPFGGTFSRRAATTLHVEHGTTLLVGVDGDVVVDVGASRQRGRAVVVPPDVAYAAQAPGPTLSYVFDPELCPEVAALARREGPHALDGRVAARVSGAVVAHRASLAKPDVLAGVGREAGAVLATGTPSRRDRRIVELVEALREPDADREAAVARTRLSAPHLRELFARDVGIAMRTYLLWRRLLHGLAHVGPLDFTASAHAAGFSDLAHFSRTCRRMLGYSPAELRANLAT